MHRPEKFEILKGKILKEVKVDMANDDIYFIVDENEKYKMYHSQSCCESVSLEDVCGQIDWLIGTPILLAEERTNSDDPKEEDDDSFTWTFYEIATINGSVTIRWYGTSNGYYSERVDFERCEDVENN